MALWFHRNPLKATSLVTFELKGVVTTFPAQKLCSEIRQARNQLIDLYANPSNQVSIVVMALNSYLSLLYGFITAVDESGGDSKLRYIIKFRWTNTLLGNKPTENFDSVFERASMLYNFAIWLTKHSAVLAGKDEPNIEEAKEILKCLKMSAGVFHLIKTLVAQLIENPEATTDLNARILDTYEQQSIAEAQEITIARAIELKHSASLIAGLAHETAQYYNKAVTSLSTLPGQESAKWLQYLQFKAEIYLAYAYNYHGETLLAQDQCGDAIKCLQESQSHYTKATQHAKSYSTIKGPGTTVKPHEHLFFRKLGPIVNRTLEKCVRENGFIYHHKVPETVPDVEFKASYGLATPEDFELPLPNIQWTSELYKAFDLTKNVPDKKTATKQPEGDIPSVKEVNVSGTGKDPNNSSGCFIS